MRNWKDLKYFAEACGFFVTSTNSGSHNKGSKHYLGLAIDVRTRDKTNEQIEWFLRKCAALGVVVRDERFKPKGQKVWSGAHLHLEIAANTIPKICAFQCRHGLRVDGIAGPNTLAQLNSQFGNQPSTAKIFSDLRDDEIILDLPEKKASHTSAEKSAIPCDDSETVVKEETIVESFDRYGKKIGETVEQHQTSIDAAVKVSRSSTLMTIVSKIGAWFLLIYGIIQDNIFEIIIAVTLIIVVIYFYTQAKERATWRKIALIKK